MQHPVVVFGRDADALPDLPVGVVSDVVEPVALDGEAGAVAVGHELQLPGVGHEVGLDVGLTLDFHRQVHQCSTLFHCGFLLVFLGAGGGSRTLNLRLTGTLLCH